MTKKFHILLLSLQHFLVDGICACALMILSHQLTSNVEVNGMIVLYDVLAFGTQPMTGNWVDKFGVRPWGLILAMVLLAGGTLVSSIHTSQIVLMSVMSAILLGMGNSLFHVYGGKYVAVAFCHDIRAMGLFVSTGAVGLAIGICFSSLMLLAVLLFALLTLSYIHLQNAYQHDVIVKKNSIKACTQSSQTSGSIQFSIPVFYLSCLMLAVAGRAFIGESVPSLRASIHSVSATWMMVMVSAIVMLGKVAGGFLSKWYGVQNVFLASMLLGSTSFLMCSWHNGFVPGTLFLINLSMPCTIFLAIKAIPRREGLAFGLLAMALLPGFLLGQLTKNDATCQYLLVPLVATILLESLLLLCMRERRWHVLAASVMFNIFTNVPLNAFVMSYRVTSPLYLVALECMVVMVEFFCYWIVLHERRRAFRYSFLCNTFSALVGYLCQLFFFDYLGW